MTAAQEGWILNEAVKRKQHLVQQLREAETEMLAGLSTQARLSEPYESAEDSAAPACNSRQNVT